MPKFGNVFPSGGHARFLEWRGVTRRVAEGRFTEWRGVLRIGEAWLVQWRKGVEALYRVDPEWIPPATSGGAWHDMRVNKNILRADTYGWRECTRRQC